MLGGERNTNEPLPHALTPTHRCHSLAVTFQVSPATAESALCVQHADRGELIKAVLSDLRVPLPTAEHAAGEKGRGRGRGRRGEGGEKDNGLPQELVARPELAERL